MPEIGILKRDLQTLATILFHVGQGKLFIQPQITEIDTLIQGWDLNAEGILSSYWPGGHKAIPGDTSLYTLLNNWATIPH